MFFRCLRTWFLAVCPLLCLAADDLRPVCSSQNQGQMWPEAANHDPKLLASVMRCGELLICVHGTWRYHWEAPSVRIDQLGRQPKSKVSKPMGCEAQPGSEAPRSGSEIPRMDMPASNQKAE
jgi:hypothetical protein